MMADTIERVYKITADANDAVRELNKLNKSVGGIDSSLKKAGAALKGAFAGAAVVATINAITNAIGNSINAMDALGKTTQKLGVSAQDFTALQHAAEMTDISTEKLSASITKLNRSISDAANGGVSAGAEALRNLGVNVRDSAGELRNSADIFRDVAEAISQMPDGADKAALAMQLFGKSGAELIPLLNEGAAGLQEFAEQAQALGLVINETDTVLADQFNDNLDLMNKQFEGAKNSLVSGLLPALTQLSNELVGGKNDLDLWNDAGQKLGKTFLAVKSSLTLLFDVLKQRYVLLEDFAALAGKVFLPDVEGATARNDEIKKAWDDLTSHLIQGNEDVEVSWNKLLETVGTPAADLAENFSDQFNSSLEKGAAEFVSSVSEKIRMDLAAIEMPTIKIAAEFVYDRSALDTDALSEQFNKDFAQSQLDTTAEVNVQVSDSLAEMSSQMETAAQMNVALSKSMKDTEKESNSLSYAIGGTLSDSVGTFVDQLAAGKFSVKTFVSSAIVDIAKLIAKLYILKALQASSAFGGLFQSANGSAFENIGLPHGVYTSPTTFPMAGTGKRFFANGGIGVLAEAAPEAIMPLSRGSDGRLGVEVKGGAAGNINIHNYSNSEVSARRVDDDIEIIVNRVASDILRGGSKISRAMEGTYSVNRVRATI